MARAIYLPDALEDLHAIWRHIAEESKSITIADQVVESIDGSCIAYTEHPLLGEARPELATGVRSFAAGSYVVFYVPLADGIEVIQVIHGARDIPAHFRNRATE